MGHIVSNPDTNFLAFKSAQDSSPGMTVFGQTPKRPDGSGGNDYGIMLLKRPEGRYIALRCAALPAEWDHEAWFPLESFRAWYEQDFKIPFPGGGSVQVQSISGYTDVNNGNRFVIKLEIDGGDGKRDHWGSFTTEWAL